MIARFPLLTVSILVFAPSLLYAQTTQTPKYGPATTYYQTDNRDKRGQPLNKMYEDIEIFRRILDRKLNPYYSLTMTHITGGMAGMQGGGMVGMQGGFGNGMSNSITFADTTQNFLLGTQRPLTFNEWTAHVMASHVVEGVYLEGQGIVYTATLESLEPRGKAEAAPPPPVDEWESIRRQVRNEKEEPKKAAPRKPPEVSEVVLKLIADHGHHFSQLAPNESLILVLTVRPTHEGTAKKLTKKAEPSAAARQAHELELVGDLHLKQGQYDVAISNYLKGVELDPGAKEEAALRRKLAQCYLAQEKYDKARTELDAAVTLLKKGKDDKEKTTAPSAVLPEKLIITVPKRLLDMAATNKMSLEEFRRHTSVRKLSFGESQR